MFPCSSIYQHYPLTNQITWTNINVHNIDQNNNNTNFQIHDDHDQNPLIMISPNQHQQQEDQNIVPSIFEDDGVMLSRLLSQQQLVNFSQSGLSAEKAAKPRQRRAKQAAVGPRKRTAGKKDRHSKICTAQGLRDRRMRLSLPIARKFFDLQDMLGFDKASRTIEWLFAKSKSAIKELKDSLVINNSTSEAAKIIGDIDHDQIRGGGEDCGRISMPKDVKRMRKLLKVVARESRDKARARARNRTREKILEKSRKIRGESYNDHVDFKPVSTENCNGLEFIMKGDKHPVASTDESQADEVSNNGGANSEEDFLGFAQKLDNIINCSSKTPPFCPKYMGNNGLVRVQNAYEILTTAISGGHFCSSKTRNPSSAVMAAMLQEERNPSNPIFFVANSSNADDHHHDDHDFLADSTNVFCSLNF